MRAAPASRLPAWALILGALAAGAALGALREGGAPAAGEATPVLAAASLWHDGDLVFADADRLRAFDLWPGGPRGLTLRQDDDGRTLRFAGGRAPALLLAPVAGPFGLAGVGALGLVLLAVAGLVAGRTVAARGGGAGFVGLAIVGSTLPAWALRGEPTFAAAALASLPLALALRRRDAAPGDLQGLADPPGAVAAGGALFGLAAALQPLAAVLALSPVVELVRRRDRRRLVLGLVPALLVAGSLVGVGLGDRGEVRRFDDRYPYEADGSWESGAAAGVEQAPVLARLRDGLVGRHGGAIPHLPFVLAAILLYAIGPRDRAAHLLVAAAAVAAVAGAFWPTPPADLGTAGAVVAGLALLLVPARPLPAPAVAAVLALGSVWALPAVIASLPHGTPASPYLLSAPFRLLPIEIEGAARLPQYASRRLGRETWVVPRAAFFVDEAHPRGVWMRGATTADVVVESDRSLESVAFDVSALAPETVLTVESATEKVRVRFDTAAKRAGVPLTVAIAAAAEGDGERPWRYRLRFVVEHGRVPSRDDPRSTDRRHLGVFVAAAGAPGP